MTRPRVCVVIAQFLPWVGGAERQALMHARKLQERGHEVSIVTIRHKREWPAREMMDGVPVVRVAGWAAADRERLPGPLRKVAYLLGLAGVGFTLWRRRHRYDLVSLYQLNLLAFPVAAVCALSGKALVISLRASTAAPLDASPPGPLSEGGGRTASGRVIGGEMGDVAAIERMPRAMTALLRGLLRRSRAAIVVLSLRMQREVAEASVAPAVIQYIPNGVDTERFSPVPLNGTLPGRARTVVCVARLSYVKGIDVLIRAWRQVQAAMPEAELILAGDGPLREELEHMAHDLGVGQSVEFAGFQPDVRAQLRRAAVAVLPSRFEGLPNALLEAMACGLACVATRVSGSEDVVRDGNTGLVVEPDDHAALARALLRLLADPQEAAVFGRNGRAVVEREYAVEHVMDEYVALYERAWGGTATG